jgi:hypothetical protein
VGVTGRATAQQVGASWTYVLSVQGLKVLPGDQVYDLVCRFRQYQPPPPAGRWRHVRRGQLGIGHRHDDDWSRPRQFRTMEITAESLGNGALHGAVLLTGQTL